MNGFILIFISLLLTIILPNSLYADILMDMEARKGSVIDNLIRLSNKNPPLQNYYKALKSLYNRDFEMAQSYINRIPNEVIGNFKWLKNYLDNVRPILETMETTESKHFILKTQPRDTAIAPYALSALEKAYKVIGKDLGHFPKEKIQVEIHRTEEDFSLSSTLDKETLDRSGAIGICKFRRLMILTPEQLAFGYRWLDTLVHEYVHYVINQVSAGKCPLWLHEGIAKYLDTRWRLEEPEFMSAGNRTELVTALKEDELIPFSRMEPSMVYLDNQKEVRLAFSQVAHAVYSIDRLKTKKGIRQILVELSNGKSRNDAFKAVLDLGDKEFEERWKEILREDNYTASPGAAPDKITFGTKKDELEEYTGTGIRAHIRLGDRMRQKGRFKASIIQYNRALSKEPSNPVALTKLSRAFIATENFVDAKSYLTKCVKDNPNYVPAFLLLAKIHAKNSELENAIWHLEEAIALNPFDPSVHRILIELYRKSGHKKKMAVEEKVLRDLVN